MIPEYNMQRGSRDITSIPVLKNMEKRTKENEENTARHKYKIESKKYPS